MLNVWLMRQAPEVSCMSLKCDWPRFLASAQGDAAAEAALSAELPQRLRQCLPSNLCGIAFRVKLLAGGRLADESPVFHLTTYQWTESHE